VTYESRTRAVLAAVLTFAGLAGCSGGDARTEQIQPGLSRDSVLSVLGQPAAATAATPDSAVAGDSLKNVWRRTAYFTEGKHIEILWYSPTGEKRTAADTVPEGRVIPVVLIDGQVIGVGRNIYEQTAQLYRLPPNKY
jgi:hypothetical protein